MKLILGNWKMNMTAQEIAYFVQEWASYDKIDNVKVGIAPAFVYIDNVRLLLPDNVLIGGQNVAEKNIGALTGEVSSIMLKDKCCDFCLVGHSERRQNFNETNIIINNKIKQLLAQNITPILCIGETEQEKEAGKTQDVLTTQLKECLQNVEIRDLQELVVAYEPVWAIGTGKSATIAEAKESIVFIKKYLQKLYGEKIIPVLYGGSVKPENSADLINNDIIDGALVGGASMKAESFYQIIKNAN